MTPDARQLTMLDALFATIDAQDIDGFLAHLAQSASFRFGSTPEVRGHDNIRIAVGGFFSTIKALQHRVVRSMAADNTIVCEGIVTYTRQNDTSISLPFVVIFEMADDKIHDYKIYIDVNPLYAQ